MRKSLHCISLGLSICLFASDFVHSQDRFAYVVTDTSRNTASWTILRKINLQTGVYSDILLNGIDTKSVAYDATSKKLIEPNKKDIAATEPFGTGVAAIAYDKQNNRIYYTPMFIDQLRYIDLKTMKAYFITDQIWLGQPNLSNNNERVVSRMVIAPDGYGYAVTNDATTFIRFSTGKKLVVDQLGTLVDDPANGGISVHNACSSWGGDIVADDANNLYLVSSSNNVFKINIATKVATWLGAIKGLPAGFTTNGMAVTDDGKLLTGSQAFAKNWYLVDAKSWTATEFKSPSGVYLTSDLANSNYLSSHPTTTEITTIPEIDIAGSNAVQLYPNPISIGDNQFKIQFNKLKAGDYKIEMTDVSGKQVMTQKLNVATPGQIQTINLKPNTAQGIYLVKISDTNSKSIFTQKLVVQ